MESLTESTNGANKNFPTTNGVVGESKFTPIAICGMACRLPGKIHCPQDLWEFLMAKGDARTLVPDTRYKISSYYSPTKKPGAAVSQYGYFLDESVDLGALDTSFFSMAQGDVERLDPQQRILLEVSRECIIDAGDIREKGNNVGVYVGSFGNDWYDVTQRETQRYGSYQVATTHDYALSNRISYEMNLRGPSMTIRTACSSSLVCLNEACNSIAKGECTSAIVGSTNIIMAPALTADISEQGALSPNGSCNTFSSKAEGYVRSEGVVALYVKSLQDALRDGNPIRAVITGTAANSDGKSAAFSVPSADAQEELIRHTYRIAGIADISKTGFFECHGTGTPVGDPIEAQAIARVFGTTGGIHIGSIKPNLGHGEGASGLTAVIKAVLALEHRTIPPNIKSLPRSEKIPFEEAQLTVPTEATPWPQGRHERISVNSFGVGGSNAHLIIDSAASFVLHPDGNAKADEAAPSTSETLNPPQILVYSANSTQSLKDMTAQYRKYLVNMPDDVSLSNVAYTLANRREQLPLRTFTISSKDNPGLPSPTPPTSSKTPVLVMLFTGQGAQWPQMARELFGANQVFRDTIRSLDHHLQELGPLSPTWRIEKELLKIPRKSRVNDAEFSQPLCTALQISLIDTLASLGIKPAAVVGHSSGEIAAAYAAGGLSAKEAILVSYLRGIASKTPTNCGPGCMTAVGLSWAEAEHFLIPGVVIACDNSPRNVTLSGDAEEMQVVVAAIKKAIPSVLATTLKVDKAYHSHHMATVGGTYHGAMTESGVVGMVATIPFFSSLTGKQLDNEGSGASTFNPKYWQDNLESPVLFHSAVSCILEAPILAGSSAVFLEIGPHPALSGPLRQILTSKFSSAIHIPTLLRRQNSLEGFLTAIGRLWALNIDVDFRGLWPQGLCVPSLPRYPWNHQRRYWLESRVSREWRFSEHPYHDLLGVRVPEGSGIEPVWRNLLHLSSTPWLRDHRIRGDIVYPFAAYVAMAAEGVRQITGVQEGVQLRRVMVSTALVLREGAPTELVTNFRRHRLTDLQDSSWWEFTVTCHNGHAWTKHCSGQICASSQSSLGDAKCFDITSMPHKVHIPQWYERGRRGGAEYGPHFTALEEMRTSVNGREGLGMATTRNNWHGDEANYHLHPVILDTYLQLVCSAAHHGMRPGYQQLIPASIESLSLARSAADELMMLTSCKPWKNGVIGAGSCSAKSSSTMILEASGVVAYPLAESDIDEGVSSLTTSRAEWVPHVDFQDPEQLIKSPRDDEVTHLTDLTLLAQLAMSLSKRALSSEDVAIKARHMHLYKAWLDQEAPSSLENVDTAELTNRINDLVSVLLKTHVAPAAVAILQVQSNVASIAAGGLAGVDVLTTNGILEDFQTLINEYDAAAFFRSLAYTKPNLRILELGVGRNAMTAELWKDMTHPSGQALYSKYVYTNASPSILTALKQRFKEVPNMHFHTLDIRNDPLDQEFQETDFDLIIASDVFNTVPSLSRSLGYVRKLLAENGRLLIQEAREGLLWTKYVLGTLPIWWCGMGDNRPDEPYVSIARWEQELAAAKLQNLKVATRNSPYTSPLTTVVVAKPQPERILSKMITLLCNSNESKRGALIASELEAQGFQVSRCTLDNVPSEGQDTLVILDEDQSYFDNMSTIAFERLKRFVCALSNTTGILWVTKPVQTHCPDPKYAPVIGFARTIRSELAIDFATCETNDLDSVTGLHSLIDVFCKFRERGEVQPSPDFEYVITERMIRVNRIFPFSLNDEAPVPAPSCEGVLRMGRPGRLDSLHWAAQPTVDPREDQVEVAIYAVGLNFKDVLLATGIIELNGVEMAFGSEAAGVVLRVGPQVHNLAIGDRVVILSPNTFCSLITITEKLCEKLPDEISFEDGVSMPLVFATAIHSLIEVAHLEPGQSVLIHSGCGGVGHAAIQVARMLGAEIYTTVSTEQKADYLVKRFDIPRSNIFQSRDTSFVGDLMRQTSTRGVDVALNSLSGELLHATWHCLAKYGRMVEIGKRDLVEFGKLDMDVFLANRSYCCVALDQLSLDKPEATRRLLQTMMKYCQQGLVAPVPLAQVFSASAIQEAFQYMQKGNHIGKIIISVRERDGRPKMGMCTDTGAIHPNLRPAPIPSPRAGRHQSPAASSAGHVHAMASYLIVGGLGGLGRSIATWMVQHGARRLIFLSRSAGSTADEGDFVRMLEGMGCTVEMVRGSVTNLVDVQRAIDQATPTMPLRGIVQMSMVLRDQAFSRMTMEDWTAATEPKMAGTWHLHHATTTGAQPLKLDFFLLFSSLSGIFGQPGQANYAAANTFLDAFVLYRTGLGLPCTAIDLGAVQGVGYLFGNKDTLRKLQGSGWHAVTEEELLEAFSAAISTAQPQPSKETRTDTIADPRKMLLGTSPTVPLSSPDSSVRLRHDARLAVYQNMHSGVNEPGQTLGKEVGSLQTLLNTIKTNVSVLRVATTATLLAREIAKKLFALLLKEDQEPDITAGLVELGLDSMVAVEMRAWWKTVFGLDISILDMMAMGTPEALGKRASNELADIYGV
ncbi:hypothetical protein HYALB_00004363 [Hymenoscyphus albidus]|uniref:Polyketide synthase n=1 Tax=Hymenoscyphus albidus TaxID=595503 RepID=A0A9N9Q4L5_9HELO|nr:hypothetical protein HYALB_00004363 [Hymenoscyphus albidus]